MARDFSVAELFSALCEVEAESWLASREQVSDGPCHLEVDGLTFLRSQVSVENLHDPTDLVLVEVRAEENEGGVEASGLLEVVHSVKSLTVGH